MALITIIYMFVMQEAEGHILVPNIMRSQTDVSSLLVVLALFAGNSIGGLLGALVAIPVASVLRVIVKQIVAPAIRRETGAEI
jgi:predicted PurR-regulated permease PerM